VSAWFYLHGYAYQRWANGVFNRRAAAIQTRSIPPPPQSKSPPQSIPVQPPAIHDGDLVGRLIVPRLHISAIVREGTGEDTLAVALGHIPGTALPGQNGNSGVAGHRDTLFRELSNIRKDDLIEFQTLSESYRYRVSSTQIVSPQRADVLRASESPEITLVTCYPFDYVGPAPERFIVKARQVIDKPPTPPEQVAETPLTPESAPPAPVPHKVRPAGPRRVSFRVEEEHSRQLAPGISFGLSSSDWRRQRVNAWIWVASEQRALWLRNHRLYDPVTFNLDRGDKRGRLVITAIDVNSVSGYLVVPGRNGSN
jgi:sortase A